MSSGPHPDENAYLLARRGEQYLLRKDPDGKFRLPSVQSSFDANNAEVRKLLSTIFGDACIWIRFVQSYNRDDGDASVFTGNFSGYFPDGYIGLKADEIVTHKDMLDPDHAELIDAVVTWRWIVENAQSVKEAELGGILDFDPSTTAR
jgi:hypothetical protein